MPLPFFYVFKKKKKHLKYFLLYFACCFHSCHVSPCICYLSVSFFRCFIRLIYHYMTNQTFSRIYGLLLLNLLTVLTFYFDSLFALSHPFVHHGTVVLFSTQLLLK